MKIPQIFIPEKNLENKIHELSQVQKISPKDLTDEHEALSMKKMIQNLKTVAQKLGRFDVDNVFVSYTFKSKESKLIIEYNLAAGCYHDLKSLIVWCKKGWLRKERVFESLGYENAEERICIYIPGEWENNLNQLYMLTKQK